MREAQREELLLEARDTELGRADHWGGTASLQQPAVGEEAGESTSLVHTPLSHLPPIQPHWPNLNRGQKGEEEPSDVVLSLLGHGEGVKKKKLGEQNWRAKWNISCTQAERSGAKLLLCDPEQVTHPSLRAAVSSAAKIRDHSIYFWAFLTIK